VSLDAVAEMTPTADRGAPFPAISRRVSLLLLTVLTAQFLGLGLVEAWRDAPTFDEAYFLSSGVTDLTRHQVRMVTQHPPLPKALAALPVLVAPPVVPYGLSWQTGNSDSYALEFINDQARAGRLRRVVFLGRLVPLLETALIGWCIYALGTTLFARSAGLLSGAAWLTLPLAVGLGHVNGGDVPFTLVTLLVCLALLRYLRTRARADLVLLGLACGAALLTRLTALALVPPVALAVVAVDWRRLRRGLLAGLCVLVVAWASVWAVIRAIAPAPQYRHTLNEFVFVSLSASVRAVLRVPWPREYSTGIRDQALIGNVSSPAFLLGHAWTGFRWWYWPAIMLVKLPASTLVIIVAGVACWWGLDRQRLQRAIVIVAIPAAAIMILVVPIPRQIGLRYLLPVVALALVAGGPVVRIAHGTRARVRFAGGIALGVLAASQLFWLWGATPHSLAWTAPPFRPGYQVATDSNLDWGQDLYALQSFARGKHVVVAYFGTVSPAVLIPGAQPLTSAPPTGWLAASATSLTSWQAAQLAWLRAYCPVRTINGTILIYYFDHPPDLRPGPVRPAGLCAGAASHRVG
jgi:4-amino-4-deoxy-L-arabinose transferase-like glycosyltransferase